MVLSLSVSLTPVSLAHTGQSRSHRSVFEIVILSSCVSIKAQLDDCHNIL